MNQTDWKTDLSQAITDVAELCRLLDIPATSAALEPDYPLFVPRSFLSRIEKGNPLDPVLLQILPQQAETLAVPGFSLDPLCESLGESTACPVNEGCALLQKYAGRSLLLSSNRCGVHCRFCFRRHRKEQAGQISAINFANVSEVILSGGDPLTLDDTELTELVHYIKSFRNVKRLRVHSRLPVAVPRRITPVLGEVLRSFCPTYLVLHINHPQELSDEFFERLSALQDIVLLAQTVLLRGVNDDAAVLTQLFETLVNHRIMPYYLHQLDRVAGAAHFEVPIERGRQLMQAIQERLPGYAVPVYVQEIAGLPYKLRL